MSSLCVYLDPPGIMAHCAGPVYLASEPNYRPGAEIVFEVLAADSSALQRRIGKRDQYGFDGSSPPFFGIITSLDPCQSTHFALSLMRHKPTMRAVLRVSGPATIDAKAELA